MRTKHGHSETLKNKVTAVTNILVMPTRKLRLESKPVEKLKTAAQLIEDAAYDLATVISPDELDELIALSYRVAKSASRLGAARSESYKQ